MLIEKQIEESHAVLQVERPHLPVACGEDVAIETKRSDISICIRSLRWAKENPRNLDLEGNTGT